MKGAVIQDVKVQQESCECCKVLLLSAEIKCTRDLNGGYWKLLNGASLYVSRAQRYFVKTNYTILTILEKFCDKKDYLKE